MTDPELPPEPAQQPAAQFEPAAQPAPEPPELSWAAGVSKVAPSADATHGPAGWPGAVLSSATSAEEPARVEPQPAPPPVEIVQEVVAVPLQASEKRGPVIDAPPVQTRAAEPRPQPQPMFASAQPASPSAGASTAQTSSMPPPPPSSGGTATPPPPPAVDAPPPKKRALWPVFCHLLFLVPTSLPGLIVTTLVWVWRRKSDALVEDQGREAINMQLTYFLATVLLGVTCIGGALIPVLWIIGAILCVIAAVRSADGEKYRYPYILRIIA